MKSSEEIKNEPNAYLREVWAAGYDLIIPNHTRQTLTFYKTEEGKKLIVTKKWFNNFHLTATIKGGKGYHWLSDADGTGDRFREALKCCW